MNKEKLHLIGLFALFGALQGVWAQETWTEVGTKEALNAAITDGAHIRLNADITLSAYLKIGQNSSQTVTIDLKGHKLSRSLNGSDSNGHVVEVFTKGTLTLSGGTLSGGWATNGGGICNYGRLTLDHVSITNCKATDGGGIKNNTGGSLTITGGSITACRSDASGGAIANYGTATLTDVTITGNTSKDAGGIYVSSGATLSLGGTSSITGNTSSEHGGGGIVNQGTTSLSGTVSINGNTCHTNGGGIWNNGTLKMEGLVSITGNTRTTGLPSNLYLNTGKVIQVSGSLAGSSIGLHLPGNAGTVTSGLRANGDLTCFASDYPANLSLVNGEATLSPRTDQVYYIKCTRDEATNSVIREIKTITNYIVIDNSFSSYPFMKENTWYVVKDNVTLSGQMTVNGHCHLILCDGAKLNTHSVEIEKSEDSNIWLEIYGQMDGTGELVSTAEEDSEAAGIGSRICGTPGQLTIHGGTITAQGGKRCAGIGGAYIDYYNEGCYLYHYRENSGGVVQIYGGTVTARGGKYGAGIGGGQKGHGGTIDIHGGTVYAYGGTDGAGLGSGDEAWNGANDGTVLVTGGTVYAYGGDYAAGIGGGQNTDGADVHITGGHVYAYGGTDAAGIGSGEETNSDTKVNGGSLTVDGGFVYADGTDWGAGIGGGEDADGATVVINGGTVIAWAGADAGDKNGSAIGSEDGDNHRGSLTIADHMMVHAGQSSTASNYQLFTAAERKPACWFRPYTRIEPCDHQGATYTVSGTTAKDTHKLNCPHCLDRTEEVHCFVNKQCTVCGVIDEICTISYYLPAKNENGSYTDGIYTSTPRTEQVVRGTITVPSPNVSYLPNGVYFAGWHIGTPNEVQSKLNLATMTYWKQNGEELIEPNATFSVTDDICFTARYVGIVFTLHDASSNSDMLFTFDGKKTQRVTLAERTLYKDGQWNTLCLPFNVTLAGSPLADAEARTLASSEFSDGVLTLNFSAPVTELLAGTPYIIKWDDTGATLTETDLVFHSVTIHNNLADASTDYVDFTGTFSPTRIYQSDEKTKLYLGADNTLYYPTASGLKVNSFRAYFKLKNGLTAGEPVSTESGQNGIRAFVLNFGDEETNSIDNGISKIETVTGRWYSLDGRELSDKPTQKGIYIYNGHKVVIK